MVPVITTNPSIWAEVHDQGGARLGTGVETAGCLVNVEQAGLSQQLGTQAHALDLTAAQVAEKGADMRTAVVCR